MSNNGLTWIEMKEKSRKVWTSFGIFMILLSFIDEYQVVCLQYANKFCYNIAVSRVQLRVEARRIPIYFTWPNGGELSNKIVSYSLKTGVELLQQEALKECLLYNDEISTVIKDFYFIQWNTFQVDENLLF